MEIKKKQDFLINLFFIVACVFLVYFSIKFMTVYLFPFLIGVIIAYTVQRPASFASEKLKIKKEICAAVLSVLMYLAVLLLLFLVGWLLFSKVNSVIEYILKQIGVLKAYTEKINDFTHKFSNSFDDGIDTTLEKMVEDTLTNLGIKITDFLSGTVAVIIKKIPTFFISTVVTVVATCYISKDYDRLKNFLRGIIKAKTYETIATVKDIFTDCILKFVLGYLIIMLITFAELTIGFLIIGVESYLIAAFIVSLVDILPVLGTGTVLLPWSVILFLQNDPRRAFGMIILYVVICIVRNFTEPKIIGKQIGINPLFTLLFMFLGLKIAGIPGMIILPVSLIVIFTFYKKN